MSKIKALWQSIVEWLVQPDPAELEEYTSEWLDCGRKK